MEVPEYHWVMLPHLCSLFSLTLPTPCMLFPVMFLLGCGIVQTPWQGLAEHLKNSFGDICFMYLCLQRAVGWGDAQCHCVLLCFVRPGCGSVLPSSPISLQPSSATQRDAHLPGSPQGGLWVPRDTRSEVPLL